MHIVLLKCPHVQTAFWTSPAVTISFSRVYSNSYCSCSLEPEIIKIGQSSHKMYSNNILNFQESTTILNDYKKRLETYWRHSVCCNLGDKKSVICQEVTVNIYKYIYIVIQRLTVLLYHNSSMWLDKRDVSNGYQNQADLTSVGYLTQELSSFSV